MTIRPHARFLLVCLGLFVAAAVIPQAAQAQTAPSNPAPTVAPAAAPPAAAAAPKVLSGPVKPEDMKGVDWSGVTDAQKKAAMEILEKERCDCSCGMTLAVCRRDDSTCGRSAPLANQVIQLAKQDKPRDEIMKTVFGGGAAAHKFVAFDLAAGDSPAQGPADAKVKILYYSDYQCPFCIRLGATFDELLKAYPNDVRLVYKMHPLPMHAQAGIAAQGALAAERQGKFLAVHKELFAKSRELSREKVIEIAKGLGLDEAKFVKDMDSPEIKAAVDRESKEAESIGANGTPASFVNGRYVSGAKPLEFWKSMVEEELKWAREGNRPKFTVGKNVKDAQPAQTAQQRGPDANKVYDIKVGKAPTVGAPAAPVTILHYYDYQCPFCIRIGPTLDKILVEYPKDVRIAYKQHPLAMHNQAMISSEAVMAANAQGKFDPMHKKLHEMNARPDRDKIMEAARSVGLDMQRFTSELDARTYKADIDAMVQEAVGVGATGTPASFINGRYLSGAQPFEAFKRIIDEELAKSKASAAPSGGEPKDSQAAK